jgi:hypothetical protein
MEPKKKNSIVLVVAGFILIVILAAGFALIMSNPKPTTNPVSLRSKEPQTPEAVQNIIRQALDTRTPSLCDAIVDDAKRAYCNDNVLIVAASDKNDPSICKRIVDKATSDVCSDNFIITSALNSRDLGACDSLKDKDRVAQCKKDVQAFAGSQKK